MNDLSLPKTAIRTWYAGVLFMLLVVVCYSAQAQLENLKVNPDSPQRYTVQEGDTLWDIAKRFLDTPWHWPMVWQLNPDIENPHLIYPGDVLVLTSPEIDPKVKVLRERKLTKLKPEIRVDERDDAIPTIPPNAIQPFLTAPLVIDESGLGDTGYVAAGTEDTVILGKYSVFYARGIPNGSEFFNIFRPGKRLIHPKTEEFLGLQVLYLGDARVLEAGETTKMEVTRSHQEIGPGDQLVPAEIDIGLPYYQPQAPDQPQEAYILDILGAVAEGGPLQVIVISSGTREQIEPGHVLRIFRQEPDQRDLKTGEFFTPPPQASGLAMVFRVFEKVSYALVLESNRAVHLNDILTNP